MDIHNNTPNCSTSYHDENESLLQYLSA